MESYTIEQLRDFQRMRKVVDNMFLSAFICVVCLSIPDDLIFLTCVRGHVVCSTCRVSEDNPEDDTTTTTTDRPLGIRDEIAYYKCPSCSVFGPKVHNVILNQIASELAEFARSKCDLCNDELTFRTMANHQVDSCAKRQAECKGCSIYLDMSEYWGHILECAYTKFFEAEPTVNNGLTWENIQFGFHTYLLGFANYQEEFDIAGFTRDNFLERQIVSSHFWVTFSQMADKSVQVSIRLNKTCQKAFFDTPNFRPVQEFDAYLKISHAESSMTFHLIVNRSRSIFFILHPQQLGTMLNSAPSIDALKFTLEISKEMKEIAYTPGPILLTTIHQPGNNTK